MYSLLAYYKFKRDGMTWTGAWHATQLWKLGLMSLPGVR
jgi:hypothetical protein